MTERPNILLILADQLSWRALPAYGNRDATTPTIDRLAARGVRFNQCYTSCPLCQPARPSIWTGRFPHEHGVLSNGRNFPVDPVAESMPTLGELFSAAGFHTVHVGKQHDAGGLRGFDHVEPQGKIEIEGPDPWPYHYDTHRDQYTAKKTVEFLQQRSERPFLCIADLQNPHDICSWVGANQGPHEDVPIPTPLPPLPDNFETTDLARRPLPVQYACCTHNRLCQASHWTEENYRHYLAAYYHYCWRLDQDMGKIMRALEARSDADNTVVVFMADHGDGMAAHRMVTKQVVFYDEITRVPFIAAGPGITADGREVGDALASVQDVLPTLCELGQVDCPEGLWGRSLVPWLSGDASGSPHEYVVSEWHTEWGFTISPGRMLRTPGHKYTRYLEGDGEEFFDLTVDPGETRTLIAEPQAQKQLQQHRDLLERHLQQTSDPFLSMGWQVDKRWRSHALGYANHEGPTAPMAGAE